NPGAARLKGYTSEEVVGRHFSIFYPEEDIAAGKPGWELEIAEQDGRIEDEGWRVRKDGSLFWANVIITALRDPDGRLVGFRSEPGCSAVEGVHVRGSRRAALLDLLSRGGHCRGQARLGAGDRRAGRAHRG